MLEDYDEAIRVTAQRTIHIHSRVGYETVRKSPIPERRSGKGILQNSNLVEMIIDEHKKTVKKN